MQVFTALQGAEEEMSPTSSSLGSVSATWGQFFSGGRGVGGAGGLVPRRRQVEARLLPGTDTPSLGMNGHAVRAPLRKGLLLAAALLDCPSLAPSEGGVGPEVGQTGTCGHHPWRGTGLVGGYSGARGAPTCLLLSKPWVLAWVGLQIPRQPRNGQVLHYAFPALRSLS